MDVNGLKFWSLSRREDWFGNRSATHDLQWCGDGRSLRLAAQSTAPVLDEAALQNPSPPAPVADRMGNIARWEVTFTPLDKTMPKYTILQTGTTPSDMAFGDDDILYVARDDRVELIDTRERFQPQNTSLQGFKPTKLAPLTGGGVYALDKGQGSVARLSGVPLQDNLYPPTPQGQFVPAIENPNPPRLELLPLAHVTHATAIAASSKNRIAILCVDGVTDARIVVADDFTASTVMNLVGIKRPLSLSWVGEDEIAVLATDNAALASTAFVYNAAMSGDALPNGRVYPLVSSAEESFVNVRADLPHYAGRDGTLHTLLAVSAVTLARQGKVEIMIDSVSSETVWHRLYIEAAIPKNCQVIAQLDATDRPDVAPQYSPHYFGGTSSNGIPQAAWLDESSELPNHQGLLQAEKKSGLNGLFSVLIQRSSGSIRRIVGRYLRLSITLNGNGHLSPEIAGLRVYGSRFSYLDHYLPRLYREASDSDPTSRTATGPDYLERFLSSLEEPLTILEGKIAESHVLTLASATPSAALPWLAQWVGIDMAPGTASAKDREILKSAPLTAKLHGTLGGLRAALELETGASFVENVRFDLNELPPKRGELALVDTGSKAVRGLVLSTGSKSGSNSSAMLIGGWVSDGAIVVLEGFRLRRSFATILGANLADDDDELTGGLTVSGNSFVGDSLILGAEHNEAVLSLFSDTPNPNDQNAILDFFDKLAFRVSVLVHESATPQDLARLQRIADAESPAHVEVNVVKARYPFLVGAGALIGVDTFLSEPAARQLFRLGYSQIGTSDVIENSGLFARSAKDLQT